MTKYNENAVTEAFISVQKSKRITAIEMASTLGISRTSMSKILTGAGSPSLRLITKFLNTYPELDLVWVFSGEGTMLKVHTETERMMAALRDRIETLEKEVKTQKEFVDLLKDSRGMYREKIASLLENR